MPLPFSPPPPPFSAVLAWMFVLSCVRCCRGVCFLLVFFLFSYTRTTVTAEPVPTGVRGRGHPLRLDRRFLHGCELPLLIVLVWRHCFFVFSVFMCFCCPCFCCSLLLFPLLLLLLFIFVVAVVFCFCWWYCYCLLIVLAVVLAFFCFPVRRCIVIESVIDLLLVVTFMKSPCPLS